MEEREKNVLIVDFFNLVKRYTYGGSLADLDEAELINRITVNILNKINSLVLETNADIVYVCSDSGVNKRALSVNSNYKADRKRAKSLTDAEREKSYIEYLKRVVETLPFKFIDISNTEADLIIQCLVAYINDLTQNSVNITIVTSDSDMLQLLQKNVKIYDWNKGFVTINNWYEKYFKSKFNFNVKNYALAKSIVGDKSDGIEGIRGVGWKKIEKLFTIISKFYTEDLVISNTVHLTEILKNILDNFSSDLETKELKFLKLIKERIVSESKTINNNQSLIDLSMYETPHIYKIMSTITRKTFEEEVKFNSKDLTEMLKLDKNTLYTPEEYVKIVAKLNKATMIFFYLMKKTKSTLEYFRHIKNI